MRIFLSYHSPDEASARALKQALEAGKSDAEVFFAPQSLCAGTFIVPQLGTALDEADAVLLLPGERTGRSAQIHHKFTPHLKTQGSPAWHI
ncbi:MAG: hypothetical protein V7703_09245 [Hyphomicrobiales bacterium]